MGQLDTFLGRHAKAIMTKKFEPEEFLVSYRAEVEKMIEELGDGWKNRIHSYKLVLKFLEHIIQLTPDLTTVTEILLLMKRDDVKRVLEDCSKQGGRSNSSPTIRDLFLFRLSDFVVDFYLNSKPLDKLLSPEERMALAQEIRIGDGMPYAVSALIQKEVVKDNFSKTKLIRVLNNYFNECAKKIGRSVEHERIRHHMLSEAREKIGQCLSPVISGYARDHQ